MSIVSQTFGVAGQVGVTPRRVQMTVTDGLAAITTAGFLQQADLAPNVVYPTDVFDIIYSFNSATGTGTYGEFLPSIAIGGAITLTGSESTSQSTSSATPGTIRALVGSMTGTATAMTSGNLVGVRGFSQLCWSKWRIFIWRTRKVNSNGNFVRLKLECSCICAI